MYSILRKRNLNPRTSGKAIVKHSIAGMLAAAIYCSAALPAHASRNYWNTEYHGEGYTITNEYGDPTPAPFWVPESGWEWNIYYNHYSGFEKNEASYAEVTGTTTPRITWTGDPTVPISTCVILLQWMHAEATLSITGAGTEAQNIADQVVLKTETDIPVSTETVNNVVGGSVYKKKLINGFKLLVIDNPERKPTLLIPSVSGSASVTMPQLPEGAVGVGQCGTHSGVTTLPYALEVRRRSSGTAFGTKTTIAAGAVESAQEHVADVRLRFLFEGIATDVRKHIFDHQAELQQKLAPLLPRILRGNGVEKHAKFIPGLDAASVQQDGSIYLGRLISGDRTITEEEPVILEFPLAQHTLTELQIGEYASAEVAVKGDQTNQWFTGENGDEPWSSNFEYGQPKKITYKPNMGVPITGHSIRIVPRRVTVFEWVEADWKYVERIYTIVLNDENIHASPPVIFKADLSEYVEVGPAVSVDSGGGTYSAVMKVDGDIDQIVTNVRFVSKDGGVFNPKSN